MPIVDLPFIYPVVGTLRGKRNSQTYWVKDTLPIDLPERAQSDLGEVKGNHRLNLAHWTRGVEGRRPVSALCTKSADSRNWDPVTPAELSRVMDRAFEDPKSLSGYPVRLTPKKAGAVFSATDLNFREMQLNGRDQAAARATAALQGGAIVDGQIQLPGGEPFWHVKHYTDRARGDARVAVELSPSAGDPTGWVAIRADRLDLAMEFARRYAGRVDADEVRQEYDLIGLDGIDLAFDDIGWMIRNACRTAYRGCESTGLRNMPNAFFGAFLDLRALEAKGDETSFRDAAEFRRIAGVMLDAISSDKDAQRFEVAKHVRRAFDNALWFLDQIPNHELAEAPNHREEVSEDIQALAAAL